jgi:serine phosphatase RsbU (regulator of sigma subunit)/tetratricopeptide (TPR) repeat protein
LITIFLNYSPIQMIRSFYTFIFLIVIFHFSFAGSNRSVEKDSLLKVTRSRQPDTLKVKAYLEIGNLYFGADADSILFYSNKALEIIDANTNVADERSKKVFLTLKGEALNSRGYGYCHLGDYLKGLADYQEAIKLRERTGNKEGIAESLNNIAVLYDEQGDAARAVDYYLKSLKLLEEVGQKYGMGYILNNISYVYRYQGDIEKSIDYSKRSLAIRREINDKKGIGESLNSLGLIEADNGNLDSALLKFESALKIAQELGAKIQEVNSMMNIGKVHLKKKKYAEAMDYFQKSQVIGLEMNDHRSILNSHLAICQLHLEMNNLEAALINAQKALQLAEEARQPEVINAAASYLQRIYRKKGDYKKALEMYELSVQMKDSILSTANKRASVQKEFQYLYEKKSATDSIRNAEQIKLEEVKHEQEISKQRSYTYGGIAGFFLMLVIAGISFNAFRNKKRSNQEIRMQKLLVEEKQKEIVDSINYAKRIQFALLTNEKMFGNNLASYFILFKPKDIVSGDFYWAAEKNNKFYLAVCDCTGHGVPGAFMSLLNISFLNEAVNERNIERPNEILNYVRERVINNLSHEGAQDGMDATLLCIDKGSGKVTYSAANNSPVLIRKNELIKLHADKMPVGKGIRHESFTHYNIEAEKGDTLYFYTDGYADQFGGEKGKKLKYKQLHEILLSAQSISMEEQKKEFENYFDQWKGRLEQVDDVCIIGIRI